MMLELFVGSLVIHHVVTKLTTWMIITFSRILPQAQPFQMGQNLGKEVDFAGWIMLSAIQLRTGH